MKQYYMVWNPQTKFTSYKHDCYGAAKEEAARLARNNAGQEFVVLCAVATLSKQDVVCDEVPLSDHIPF